MDGVLANFNERTAHHSFALTAYGACCDCLSGICDVLTAYGAMTTNGGLTAY